MQTPAVEEYRAFVTGAVIVKVGGRLVHSLVLTDRRLILVLTDKPSLLLNTAAFGLYGALLGGMFTTNVGFDPGAETPSALASRSTSISIPYDAVRRIRLRRERRLAGAGALKIHWIEGERTTRKLEIRMNPFPDLIEHRGPPKGWEDNPAMTISHVQDLLRRQLPAPLVELGEWLI